MALIIDWISDIAETNATVSIEHHTSTPLSGNRSVRFNITTGEITGAKGGGAIFLNESAHTRGHLMGRLRSLMRVDSLITHGGIFFLASQDIGIAGAGSCYVFGPTGSTNALQLRKLSAGIFDESAVVLETAGINVGPSPTDLFALEAEWKSSLDIFGGVSITCRYGLTFGTMDTVLEYVDESAPLIVSSAEGLCAYRTGVGVVGQVIFDNTTLHRAIPA